MASQNNDLRRSSFHDGGSKNTLMMTGNKMSNDYRNDPSVLQEFNNGFNSNISSDPRVLANLDQKRPKTQMNLFAPQTTQAHFAQAHFKNLKMTNGPPIKIEAPVPKRKTIA